MESEQMKVVFRQGKIALLDTPNEYIVATDYDWITRKWRALYYKCRSRNGIVQWRKA